ncbi:berberine bridge enzyme-like D-2 [Magnolia sinica]|uniref:berberine bridge enzyme-like D-2 n=1 Tax=Magnolia sinica TaxID=86752 RepID=UPI00265AEC1A|nr:berberine bridge enzyme-like D-2 [Magnolia sinica]
MESQTSLHFILLLGCLLMCACREDLLTCLSQGGVTNITTSYNPDFLHFLDSSNQNLRVSKPFLNKPIAVVFPENKYQVQTVIRCSRQGSWEIRLRSGGHSFEGLSSVADGPFVIIDLMNLNRVTVDLESETTWVEGGATLGQLYNAIATASNRHGFSGGVCPTVGTGGHISGGGYGTLIRKYGVAADNVVDAVLVAADGQLLDRKSMGKEVFWAIRGGGGGNWGVVVAWKIRLLEVPENVTLFRIDKSGTTSQTASLWYKWQLVAPKLDENFFLQVLVWPGTTNTTDIFMFFTGLYLGPKASALAIISNAFPELGVTLQDCNEMSWAEGVIFLMGDPNVRTVADLKNRFAYHKTFIKSKSDYVKVPIPLAGLKGALEILSKLPKASLLLDPYGGINDRIRSDAIAFPHRVGNLYSIEYFLQWEEEDNGKSGEYLDALRRLYEYMGAFLLVGPRAVYVNNVDLDLGVIDWSDSNMNGVESTVEVARAWGEKYFLGNYDRLVRAKTLIDPSNIFRHPQSIPPWAYGEGRVY